VGHRAGPKFPEDNFHSSRGVYRVRALHVGPRNEGQVYSASEMDAVSACAAPDTAHRTDASEYRATASGWNAGGHGSCHRPYSADDGEVQPRTGHSLVGPSPPLVHGRYRPVPAELRVLRGRRTNPNHVLPERLLPRRWAWNRPYRREAAPSLPIETLRDWLALWYDAGDSVASGWVAFVGFIPAVNGGAFSSHFRNAAVRSLVASRNRSRSDPVAASG
jgi:hypothetical protein